MPNNSFVLPVSAGKTLTAPVNKRANWRVRLLACVIFVATLVFTYPAFAAVGALPSRLNDQASIFTAKEIEELYQSLEQHEQSTGQLFAVLTLSDVPDDIEAYAQNIFSEWGLHDREAALILIAPEQQRIHIHVGRRLHETLPAHKAEAIGSGVIAPWFDAKRYHYGVKAGLDRMMKLGSGEDVVLLPEVPVVEPDNASVPLLELMLVLVALFGVLAHWTLGAKRRLPEYMLGSANAGPVAVGAASRVGDYQGRW